MYKVPFTEWLFCSTAVWVNQYPTPGFAFKYADMEAESTMMANDVTALICKQISFLYLQYFVYKINVFVPVMAPCICVLQTLASN